MSVYPSLNYLCTDIPPRAYFPEVKLFVTELKNFFIKYDKSFVIMTIPQIINQGWK